MVAALLLTSGVVFVVEMLQRLFSQDYRALALTSAAAPPVALFGRGWSPAAWSTWIIPAGLLAAGSLLSWCAVHRLRALAQNLDQDAPTPVVDLPEGVSP
ncbi:hypothetical protein D3C84_1058900 [compost metagenome]